MDLALILHSGNPVAVQAAQRLLNWAVDRNLSIHLSNELFSAMVQTGDLPGKMRNSLVPHHTHLEALQNGEITVAIGGDGTILKTAHLARSLARPLLGINSGKLGFLANIQLQNMDTALDDVLSGNFELDQRYFLEARLSGGGIFYALNEFVFSRKVSASMITLLAEYDGQVINKYWADGIIVSSPTGSTAYNLSAGGPIVLPRTGVMVLTPISPHTLTTRSLVLPSDKKLTIKVEPVTQKVLFSGDGIIIEMPTPSSVVSICKSDQFIPLIKPSGQSYFQTLRNKLMWGADMRELR